MKLLDILILTLMTLFAFIPLQAQDSTTTRERNKWYVPDFATLQYAGSIGFLSVGAGYTIFKDKANIDLLFGYVPASMAGGASLETITLKFTAAPWKISLDQRILIRPFSIGMYFCYTPGRQYSSDLPAWYPDGYYWWSEAVRANLFIGGNGSFATEKLKHISKVDLYYELGTNEIKFVSYVQNTGALTLGKILHLGIGVRVHFSK